MDYSTKNSKLWDKAYANYHIDHSKKIFSGDDKLGFRVTYLEMKMARYILEPEAKQLFEEEIELTIAKENLLKLKN